MSSSTGKMNLRHLDPDSTLVITVHVTRELRVRLWIAKRLFRLAARVLNCGARVESILDIPNDGG